MGHLVIGAGEVGTAITAVLSRAHDVELRDVDPIGDVVADVVHVCYPWGPDFVAATAGYAAEHEASLVVVHSTVPVGTCDSNGWVHSPVRGRHPHLVEGISTFVKHFGGVDAKRAAGCFEDARVAVEVHERAADTEAAKLWELVQYGLQIQVEKQIHGWCADRGVDFDVVYSRFAETYNDGWVALGHPEYVRPVLVDMPGPIGGHCVRQGAALIDHFLAELVDVVFH